MVTYKDNYRLSLIGVDVRKFSYRQLLVIFSLIVSLAFILNGCGGSNGGRSNTGEAPSDDTTPPTVSSTSPANGTNQIPLNIIISATFSESLDPDTVSKNTFFVINASSGATVSGEVVYTDETKTASFTPSGLMGIDTSYVVNITTSLTDQAGNPMDETFSWSFTTGAVIDNSPPSFPGNDPQLVAQATSSNSISLEWVKASDNTTLSSQLLYVVCRSTVSTDCTVDPFPATGGNVVISEIAAGQLTQTEDDRLTLGVTGLNSNAQYYFVVRAKDQVNLLDGNTVQESATTFGVFVSLGTSLNKNSSKDARDPSIAIVGSTPYLAWWEGNTPADVYVKTFDTTSEIWSTETKINTVGNHALQPKIASNGAATPVAYITYTECDSGGANCKVYVKKWNAGGNTWDLVGGELNVDGTKSAADSAIAFDGSNTPYVIWVEPDGSGINQIYVSHFNGSNWVQDGGSLNIDATKNGSNPAIAINGSTIKVSWTECIPNLNDCQLYVKGWDSTNSIWTPANPNSLKAGDPGLPSRPNDVSLGFINQVLHVVWHENASVYARKEQGNTFVSVGTISTVVSTSSNAAFGSAATGSQVPFITLVDNSNATANQGPHLFVKKWDGTQWVTEGSGALNMTGGGGFQTITSAIGFSGGTPYVAWIEKGSCLVNNGCGQNNTNVSQLYVKRLE